MSSMRWHILEDHRAESPDEVESRVTQYLLRQSILNVIRAKRQKLLQVKPLDVIAMMELDLQEDALLEEEAREQGVPEPPQPKRKNRAQLFLEGIRRGIRNVINNILRDIIRWQVKRDNAKRWIRTSPVNDPRDTMRQDNDRLAITRRQAW